MRTLLSAFFALVLAAMAWLTVAASLDRGVFTALSDLWSDLWFRATLADAYFAFLTIWFWIAYREPSWPRRLIWLVALLLLGNFAIAAYGILALRSLPDSAPIWHALLRPSDRPNGIR